MSTYPAELLERILKEVRATDWPGLKNCALVSPTFLHIARQILFGCVNINLDGDVATSAVGSSTRLSTGHFLEFLANDRQTASCIRQMSIRKKLSFQPQQSDDNWQESATSLSKLLPKLTRLLHLSIHSSSLSDWTTFSIDLHNVLMKFSHTPTLQTLELFYLTLNPEELMSLTRLPGLTLCCINVIPINGPARRRSSPTNILDPQPSPPSLETRLRDLTINPKHTVSNPEDVWMILKASEKVLTSLACVPSPHDTYQLGYLEEVHLGNLIALLSLTVCISLEDGASISSLVSLFSKANDTSKLERVEIWCDYDVLPPRDVLESWVWHQLDDLLTCPIFSVLREVRIVVKRIVRAWNAPKRNYAMLEIESLEIFKTYLPLAAAQGLIVAG